MSVEDFWWNTHNELQKLGLQKKFDKQMEKMKTQDKHKYKDPKEFPASPLGIHDMGMTGFDSK